MKVEPIRMNIPTKHQQRSASPTRIPKPSRSSALGTTPNTASGTSSEEESSSATNKVHVPSTTATHTQTATTAAGTAATTTARVKKNNPLTSMNVDRRASLKTPRITPASPRDNTTSGISSATNSPRARPIHTRRPSASSVRKLSLSIVNTKSGLHGSHDDGSPSIGPVPTRTRKISTSSMGATNRLYSANGNNSRKNSIASATEHESLVDKEVSIRKLLFIFVCLFVFFYEKK